MKEKHKWQRKFINFIDRMSPSDRLDLYAILHTGTEDESLDELKKNRWRALYLKDTLTPLLDMNKFIYDKGFEEGYSHGYEDGYDYWINSKRPILQPLIDEKD